MADKTHSQDDLLAELCQQKPFQSALHRYYYIHGLITAVSACPEIPMPEQWMAWTFKASSAKLNTSEQDKVANALMTTLQSQLRCMTEKSALMPNETAFTDSELQKVNDTLSVNSPLSLWCSGLLAGHSQLENVWLNAWDKMLEKEPTQLKARQKQLKHVLSMLSTFANVPLAIEQAENNGNSALRNHLATIARSLPNALNEYVDLSGSLVSYIENQFETFVKPTNS